MDEEVDRLVIGVRADTQAFARDVATLRATLDGPFGTGVARAGQVLDATLARAVRTGKLGFDDLKRVALSALAEIAAQAIRAGLGGASAGQGRSASAGLVGLGSAVIGTLLGLPGRATGGPVSPGRSYLVGERGPEIFTPTQAGSITPGQIAPARDVRIAISIQAPPATAPDMLARSSRQVARAVRGALLREG
jgi:hypothetical protein